MSDKGIGESLFECKLRDQSSTMALRMLTEKITTAAARQYQKIVATELNTFGTSKLI